MSKPLFGQTPHNYPKRTRETDGYNEVNGRLYPFGLYKDAVREPANPFVERASLDSATLKWSAQYYLNAGYQAYLNGVLVGFTPTNTFTLRELDPEANYTIEVKTVWEDGTASERNRS